VSGMAALAEREREAAQMAQGDRVSSSVFAAAHCDGCVRAGRSRGAFDLMRAHSLARYWVAVGVEAAGTRWWNAPTASQ
jgi:hypothetical protein